MTNKAARWLWLAAALAACGGQPAGNDGGARDGAGDDAPGAEASVEPDAPLDEASHDAAPALEAAVDAEAPPTDAGSDDAASDDAALGLDGALGDAADAGHPDDASLDAGADALGDDGGAGADARSDAGADAAPGDAERPCPAGLARCSGACVDLRSDARHCGSCANACGATQVCVVASCETRPSGLLLSELRARTPQFLELFNGGAEPVELRGHLLQWASDSGASGSVMLPAYVLEPGAFVALRTDAPASVRGMLTVSAAPVWSTRIAVRLLSPTGVGLDFVRTADSTVAPPAGSTWSGAGAPNPSRDLEQSLVRNVYLADTDTAGDWSLAALSSPGDYCARAGRCGALCADHDNDRANCGGCGVTCGAGQLCRGGACAPGAGGLVLSEVRLAARPAVELYNPTATAVSVRNYRLQVTQAGATRLNFFLPEASVPPGGYLAIYEGAGVADARTLYTNTSGAFVPDGAYALFDNGTTALDFVPLGGAATAPPSGASWFGAAVPNPSTRANASARRNVAALDTDSAADWSVDVTPATLGFACVPGLTLCGGRCVRTDLDPTSCGACGAACTANATCVDGQCRAANRVLLSRLRNRDPEQFELFNGTSEAVNVGGWVVTWVADGGSNDYTIPAGTMLAPAGYLLLEEGSGASAAGRLFMARAVSWGGFLAVSVRQADGTPVDFVRTATSPTEPPLGMGWSGEENAPNPSNVADEVLARDVYATDTDTAADWSLRTGEALGAACAAGSAVCAGRCARVREDPQHCGACGNACGFGSGCVSGQCALTPSSSAQRDGDARLVGGATPNEGALEVYYSGSWRGVCDDSVLNAGFVRVVCRQLGYDGEGVAFGNRSSTSGFWLDDVSCNGAEPTLFECRRAGVGVHNCGASEHTFVRCNR